MGTGHVSFGKATKVGAFLAAIALALCLPAVAFAANTATFSSVSPQSGSSSTATKPTVTVTVYDKYGSFGAGTKTMWVGGVKVSPTVTYLSGRTKFKLTYVVKTPLALGYHTATVKIIDLKKKTSKYSWGFTTIAAGDVTPPVTTSDAQLFGHYTGSAVIHLSATDNVGVTHSYYEIDGAQTPSLYTGSITVPGDGLSSSHMLTFWSVDAAGNTEAPHVAFFVVDIPIASLHFLPTGSGSGCTIAGCHDTDLMTIHQSVCSDCHNSAQPTLTHDCTVCHGVNGPHGDNHIAIASTSTEPTACTSSACHGANAITIHKLGCAECHSNTDPDVVAAIAAGEASSPTLATCETCHGGFTTIHSTYLTKHAVTSADSTSTCVGSTCHAASDVTTIHSTQYVGGPAPQDCWTCHKSGTVLTKSMTMSCTQPACHSAGLAVHTNPAIPAAHVTTNACGTANGATCHVSDVSVIHTTRPTGFTGTIPGCAACHATGQTPSTNCQAVGCHPTSPHTSVAAHDASANGNGCFLNGCHGTSDASAIHANWINPPGCAACHAADKTASTNCTPCHTTLQGYAPHDAAHEASAHASALPAGCLGASCHASSDGSHVNLETQHSKYGLNCVVCHDSDDARVAAAITGKNNACLACHSGTGSDDKLNSNYHGAEFLNPGNASGHNIAGNSIGAKSKFDGSQGVTLKDTAGNVVSNDWDLPTANVFKPGALDDSGHQMGWTSVVTCQDCHDAAGGIQNATGPHGAQQSWAVDPAYPYPYTMAVNSHLTASGIVARKDANTNYATQINALAGETMAQAQARETSAAGLADASAANTQYAVICAKCHQLFDSADAFSGPGGVLNGAPGAHGDSYNINTGVNNDSNTAHASHHFDLNNGAADCVNCHVAIPHGWTRPRLLVNGLTGTYVVTDGTTTSTVNSVADPAPYWAGRGMLMSKTGAFNGMGPLSAEDNHSINTSGGVVWDESSCIACSGSATSTTNPSGLEHSGVPSEPAKLK